jgi:hypothetical protein
MTCTHVLCVLSNVVWRCSDKTRGKSFNPRSVASLIYIILKNSCQLSKTRNISFVFEIDKTCVVTDFARLLVFKICNTLKSPTITYRTLLTEVVFLYSVIQYAKIHTGLFAKGVLLNFFLPQPIIHITTIIPCFQILKIIIITESTMALI